MAFPNMKARMAYFAKQKDAKTGMMPIGSMGASLTSKPNLGAPKNPNPNMKIGVPPVQKLNMPLEPTMPKPLPNEPKGPILPKAAKFPRIKKFFKG
jgi:hypothetical protein